MIHPLMQHVHITYAEARVLADALSEWRRQLHDIVSQVHPESDDTTAAVLSLERGAIAARLQGKVAEVLLAYEAEETDRVSTQVANHR